MTSIQPKVKLTGDELKNKVDSLIKDGAGFSACCRSTGYTNITATGTEIPAASSFSRALLDSLGYKFPSSGGGGRSRDYIINIMKAGNAILSKGYLTEAGLKPDDVLAIELKDDGSMVLSLDNAPSAATGGGASQSTIDFIREPAQDDWSDDFAE